MSRSDYSDDLSSWSLICWRGAVASAIRGKRGQGLLKELLAGLDAMEVKRLIPEELEFNGEYCALGVVGKGRGLDMSKIDVEDSQYVAEIFDTSDALVREIAYMNDETWYDETPEHRFDRMRNWVVSKISI